MTGLEERFQDKINEPINFQPNNWGHHRLGSGQTGLCLVYFTKWRLHKYNGDELMKYTCVAEESEKEKNFIHTIWFNSIYVHNPN